MHILNHMFDHVYARPKNIQNQQQAKLTVCRREYSDLSYLRDPLFSLSSLLNNKMLKVKLVK